MPEFLIALALFAGTAAVVVPLWRGTRDAGETAAALFRGEAQATEVLRLQRMESQLAEAQRLAEGAFAGGTNVVRTIHKGIAGIPFGILEAIPATRDTTKIVRVTHDLISDTVYGTLGAVNKGIGSLIRAGLAGRKAADDAAAAAAGQALENPSKSASDEENSG